MPPPQPGSIHQTIATHAARSAAPIPLTATATPVAHVTVSITRAALTTAKAQLPGEIAGAAVSLSVHVANGTGHAVSLAGITVNVADSSGRSWSAIESASTLLRGSLSAGAARNGVYVFHRPAGATDRITVSIDYTASAPTIVFVGRAR